MKKRENLDKLFQEKFQDYEINPPEFVWEKIEEKLKEKKKRRVVPFWWWSSGIAALLVIGLFVWNSNTNQTIDLNNGVAVEENNTKQNSEKNINIEKKKSEEILNSNTTETNQNAIVATENNSSDDNLSQETSSETKKAKTNNTKLQPNTNSIQKNNYSTILKKEAVASKTEDKKSKDKNSKITTVTEINSSVENNKNNIAENNLANDKTNKNNSTLVENSNQLKTENNIGSDKIAMKNQDNIAIKGEIASPKDSTAVATVEKNELEELLNEKEKQIAKEQKLNRWQVTPNLAPIYFGSFKDGSPLDGALDENTKSYNNNVSYGIAVDYSVSKKLKIRTGLNSLNVDYNTNEIAYFQNSNPRVMTNIEPTLQGSSIEVIPIKNIGATFSRTQSEQNVGVLNQKMGYIEMPFEVSYKLIDKKFGVEVLGGMSTFFLSNNEVFLETNDMTMKIGEATNLNSVHFSTNFGVGLNYGFLKNFQARLEPTFKYQLNTFTRDSQNFKPYIFGIYTGISYKF
jgi:hypothetical protein